MTSRPHRLQNDSPCQLLRLNFKTKSDFFLTTISRLNCPPLQDYVPVELQRESWIEREKYAARDFLLLELIFTVLHTKLAGFKH